MLEIWALSLFVMVCHEFFLTADTRSTYDPLDVYREAPVKLFPHLFLQKMDWLSNAYLFYPTYYGFHPVQEMAHG